VSSSRWISLAYGSGGLLLFALATVLPPVGLILVGWAAFASALVSMAYAVNWPGVYGKRHDGSIAWWRAFPALPVMGGTALVRRLLRSYFLAEPFHEVAPGLYVGGRIPAKRLPPDVAMIVDLVAEAPAPSGIAVDRRYHALPILDGHVAADPIAFAELVGQAARDPGPVYVHCAGGRGRAVCFATAVLVVRGVAADVTAAVEHVRRVRPKIGPTQAHRELSQWAARRIRDQKGAGPLDRS
jgi:hypothetical protein